MSRSFLLLNLYYVPFFGIWEKALISLQIDKFSEDFEPVIPSFKGSGPSENIKLLVEKLSNYLPKKVGLFFLICFIVFGFVYVMLNFSSGK